MEKVKKQLALFIFLLIFLIFSFYQYLPVGIRPSVLRIPYYIVVGLSIFVIYRIFKGKYKIKGITQYMTSLIFTLSSVYMGVTVIRFLRDGMASARPSLYLALAVIAAFVVYMCYHFDIFSIKNTKRDLIIMMSVINVGQIFSGLFTFGGLRSSLLLENIMVYNNLATILIPIMFKMLSEHKGKLMNLVVVANIITNMTFVSISGSRSGMMITWIIFAVSVLLSIFINGKKSLISSITIFLMIGGLVTTFYVTGLFNATNSIGRLRLEDTTAEYREESDIPTPTEPIFIDPYDSNVVEQSNTIRSSLWERSMSEIREAMIVGTGIVSFYVTYGEATFLQGSHNIIMEIWLIFGGLGLFVYVLLFASLIFYFIKHLILNGKTGFSLASYIISLGGTFAMALVQPLLVMLIPNMMLWLIISMGINEVEQLQK